MSERPTFFYIVPIDLSFTRGATLSCSSVVTVSFSGSSTSVRENRYLYTCLHCPSTHSLINLLNQVSYSVNRGEAIS